MYSLYHSDSIQWYPDNRPPVIELSAQFFLPVIEAADCFDIRMFGRLSNQYFNIRSFWAGYQSRLSGYYCIENWKYFMHACCSSLPSMLQFLTGVNPIKPFHAWSLPERENAAGRTYLIFIVLFHRPNHTLGKRKIRILTFIGVTPDPFLPLPALLKCI